MRFSLLLISVFLFASCSNKYAGMENSKEDCQIIPKPTKLEISKGRFPIDSKTKIVGEKSLENEGNYLAKMLSSASGVDISFAADNHNGNIVLKIDDSINNDEGYLLSVKYDQIVISGKTARGVFYGIQSLRQLMPPTIESGNNLKVELTIPAVTITDSPRYIYRGMHLDVGRHFFPIDFIKKYIDLIAMHKMNTFHWHLTEDQGWRIEIKKYPKLTEVGAWRDETLIGHGRDEFKPFKYDGKKYGGFYTQEEIKEVVAYATSRHITVIPEIELPGHSSAALAAYPEFGNTGGPYEVAKRWGVFPHTYSPTEETFKFLEDILSEVIELFPSKYIHIGGDEAPKVEWEKSKYAQGLIKKKGLKDEHGLQSYFIKRIEKFLNSKDRDIIGWDEILEGGLAPNASVMSWRGTKGGIEAAKQLHNVVMTPWSHCYFDQYQVPEDQQAGEVLAIGGYTSVEKVYNYEPTPEELTKEEQKYILGAQGNVWTEYIKTTEHLEYMVFPRMTALSEVVWSAKEDRDYPDFINRLKHLAKRYDAMGLNYAKHSIVSKKKG